MNLNLVFAKPMNLNVLNINESDFFKSKLTVKVEIYKVVKKTQNQIRTQLLFNTCSCAFIVSFFVYLLIFFNENYEFVHVVLS